MYLSHLRLTWWYFSHFMDRKPKLRDVEVLLSSSTDSKTGSIWL